MTTTTTIATTIATTTIITTTAMCRWDHHELGFFLLSLAVITP